MAAEVSGGQAAFTVTKVIPLFRLGDVADVSPDGTRFVDIVGDDQRNAAQSVTLVTNWAALLKRQ